VTEDKLNKMDHYSL